MCYRVFIQFFLVACLALSVRLVGFGQMVRHTGEPDIVRINGLYSGYGKIFKTGPDLSTGQLHVKGSFRPGDGDILKTERLMESQYDRIVRSDPRLKGLPEGYRKYYYGYYRQYAGLIDQDGDSVVYIILFTCCKKIRRCYPEWKEGLVSPLREDTCAIMNWYYVDLTKEKVTVY